VSVKEASVNSDNLAPVRMPLGSIGKSWCDKVLELYSNQTWDTVEVHRWTTGSGGLRDKPGHPGEPCSCGRQRHSAA